MYFVISNPLLMLNKISVVISGIILWNCAKKNCGNETKKLINIYVIVFSMAYLHSLNIFHRDLIPAYIYLGLMFFCSQNLQILDSRKINHAFWKNVS